MPEDFVLQRGKADSSFLRSLRNPAGRYLIRTVVRKSNLFAEAPSQFEQEFIRHIDRSNRRRNYNLLLLVARVKAF
jgi:hypothetical protein